MATDHFTAATVIEAEGARVGLVTCDVCGAAVLIDPRDPVDRPAQHLRWHALQDARPAEPSMWERLRGG